MSTRTTAAKKTIPAPPKAKTKTKSQPSAFRYWLKRIILVTLILGVSYLAFEYFTLPKGSEFKSQNPASTAMIDARLAQAKSDGRPATREQTWVPISRISRNLVRAVLAGEDDNFFKHNGFDTDAIQKAIIKDWQEKRFARGASTISQQLAKNLYLSESKNPLRKLKEAVITSRLEANLTKKRILEIYLNVIEWGDGIYGAEAAARHYFGKSAAQLSVEDSTFLAAMIPNPRTVYNPKKNPRQVAHRQRILGRRLKYVVLPKDW